jgi:hypothetical protein
MAVACVPPGKDTFRRQCTIEPLQKRVEFQCKCGYTTACCIDCFAQLISHVFALIKGDKCKFHKDMDDRHIYQTMTAVNAKYYMKVFGCRSEGCSGAMQSPKMPALTTLLSDMPNNTLPKYRPLTVGASFEPTRSKTPDEAAPASDDDLLRVQQRQQEKEAAERADIELVQRQIEARRAEREDEERIRASLEQERIRGLEDDARQRRREDAEERRRLKGFVKEQRPVKEQPIIDDQSVGMAIWSSLHDSAPERVSATDEAPLARQPAAWPIVTPQTDAARQPAAATQSAWPAAPPKVGGPSVVVAQPAVVVPPVVSAVVIPPVPPYQADIGTQLRLLVTAVQVASEAATQLEQAAQRLKLAQATGGWLPGGGPLLIQNLQTQIYVIETVASQIKGQVAALSKPS